MAHHKSALKRIRRSETRTKINRARISRVRNVIRIVEAAVAEGKRDQAVAALRVAEPEIMRGASKGLLKRNTASRRVSRLVRLIKAMPS